MILVSGVCPHTGTSIMRRIIGAHPDVTDFPEEINHWPIELPSVPARRFVVKMPTQPAPAAWPKKWRDVCMVRDPRAVAYSMALRSGRPYEQTAAEWIRGLGYARAWDTSKVWVQRYETFFRPGGEPDRNVIRWLFKWLGLDDAEEAIDVALSPRVGLLIGGATRVPDSRPEREDHASFRTWQINQPVLRCDNGWEVDMSPEDRAIVEATCADGMHSLGYM